MEVMQATVLMTNQLDIMWDMLGFTFCDKNWNEVMLLDYMVVAEKAQKGIAMIEGKGWREL